jgi:uncharacterized integral membrane protein
MVRKIVAVVILVPLAILMVMFAVANRASVPISLDPFSSEAPAFTLHAPLFIVLLVTLTVGVIAGGIGAWVGQAKWRRTARALARDLRAARADAEDAHRRLAAPSPPPAVGSTPSLAYRRAPAA